jgi:transposase-like protein
LPSHTCSFFSELEAGETLNETGNYPPYAYEFDEVPKFWHKAAKGEGNMPSPNSKYSPEMRENTARHILESGKSATSVAEEMGIDVNTVCKWVRDFRKKHGLPTWAEEKGIRPLKEKKTDTELMYEKRESDRENKRLKKEIADRDETIEILKKSLLGLTGSLQHLFKFSSWSHEIQHFSWACIQAVRYDV